MLKNYLTIWQRWAVAKAAIVAQHGRLLPLIKTIKEEIKKISGQDVPARHMDLPGLRIKFYPFWEGWCYTYEQGWRSRPDTQENWGWSLKETEAVANFLQSLQEEEIKSLFRQWSEAE